jgi:hypothetical protein
VEKIIEAYKAPLAEENEEQGEEVSTGKEEKVYQKELPLTGKKVSGRKK